MSAASSSGAHAVLPRYAARTSGSSLDHAGIPVRDHAAAVDDQESVDDAHHQVHVVLDQDDGDALVAQAAQQARERLHVLTTDTGGRFIDQQDLGPGTV